MQFSKLIRDVKYFFMLMSNKPSGCPRRRGGWLPAGYRLVTGWLPAGYRLVSADLTLD